MSRIQLLAALLLVFARATAHAQTAEILWDRWGVPHIYAAERSASLYAFGWAQMEAHAALITELYGKARGEAAAHLGRAQLQEDMLVQQLDIPTSARRALAAQDSDAREQLEHFVRGMNDYLAQHPQAVPATQRWVLPLTAADVLAHMQRVLLTRFLFADAAAIADYAAQAPARMRASAAQGSNAYAIGPQRSASGRALLLINPHLPWSAELTLFEAQLVEGERFVYGAALVGQPYVSMGFTERLGWAHTVNAFDAMDTYELTLAPGGYVLDGQVQAFETLEPAQLRVKESNGKLSSVTLPRVRSVHGPVVYLDARRGKALAVRYSSGALDQLLRRYWQQADARDRQQFEAAADRDRLACFNTLYADSQGQLLYRYEGVMPRRSGGDYASWQGIQSGVSRANLWQAYYPVSALPRVLNPASGFLQNANDPPWFVTLPALAAADYPPYIAPPQLDLRAQQSLARVSADTSITFEELVALKQSNRVELADRVLPELLAAARSSKTLEPACAVLEAWDHTLDPPAHGALLFFAWADAMDRLAPGGWFAQGWSAQAPTSTPRGLADPALAVRALREASRSVASRYRRLDIPYGQVARLRRGGHDLPASAGPVRFGVYSAAELGPVRRGTSEVWGGDSFIAVVELGPPPHAQGLLTYGNASQPGSPFVGDQLELFSRRALRPLFVDRADVQANLHHTEPLRPGGN